MTKHNPYAAPTTSSTHYGSDGIALEPKDRKKVEAIIKDAGQFWLAIILCFLCSLVGALIIPIWYTVRLLQWNSLANKYPALVSSGAPGSIQVRFKSSQWKLIVGLTVGCVVFLGAVVVLLSLAFTRVQ